MAGKRGRPGRGKTKDDTYLPYLRCRIDRCGTMILSGSSFWAPVGIVIFAGGVFLLLMTITILPVLYWKLNDSKK